MSLAKILIVEDEFLIRLTLAEALSEDGFDVIEAASGKEAVDLLASHQDVALLLTDIQLPGGMNGIEVARAARCMTPDLPVIYMTGRPDRIAAAATSPHDVFIAKPYLPSEICATARRLTGG